MQAFPTTPRAMYTGFCINRALIMVLIKREVLGRYRGSIMGVLWSFFNPMCMLAVYTFVFAYVFKARWGTTEGSRAEFALILFAGLIVFNFFAECVTRAPGLVLANANYVKRVIFPLEVLAWSNAGAALFHAGVSLLVWIIFYCIGWGIPHWTIVLLPVVVLPLGMISMGFSWFLASLGVYLRDVSQIMGLVTTILMFMSPIFYPSTALPERFRSVFLLNPLTPAVEQAREVLIFGRLPDWTVLGVYLIVGIVVMCLGFAWFQKTRRGFADVV
ncbi:ABC transporter permease [Bordetella flabilis]|uniref:Transport permease protein n=1 Tax=Bordetella flabilis TaxID=463014 RepID=A0A193GK03_9BORD|nr:ABC transporter permease [Bordetella flabilis]ANN79918.1 sugar ABC transporter permease [Bordetella flabilis]